MHEPDERPVEQPDGPPPVAARASTWWAVGLVVYLALSLYTYQDVIKSGFSSSALIAPHLQRSFMAISDVTFEAWLVARNAYTLSREPLALFDTPHCYPGEKTLTYGIPMITMGMLAVPVSFFTANPTLAYNLSIAMIWLVSGIAMFLLVKEWTGVPAAGVVAGLAFAFTPVRMGGNVIHPSVWDASWLVFALYFSQRLFARGAWRDAFGLAAACALQMAASFYPFVASVFFAPFFLAWLLYRYRLEHVRLSQLAFVLVVAVVAAALCFGPYLESRSAGALEARSFFFYSRWSWFAPGKHHFLGWGTLSLALLGLLIPTRRAGLRITGDPRWALLIGGLFVAVLSMGPYSNEILGFVFGDERPFEIPSFYKWFAEAIPGLDSVRVVARLTIAPVIALCIFSGIGAAWLIRSMGERGPALAGVLVAIVMVTTATALPRPTATEVRVDPSEVAFFAALAELGNDGPIIELPVRAGLARTLTSPRRIMLSRYHHRRTWTCFGSYHPEGREQTQKLIDELPALEAQRALRKLGFTTIILRHSDHFGDRVYKSQLEAERRFGPRIIHSTGNMTAYELRS